MKWLGSLDDADNIPVPVEAIDTIDAVPLGALLVFEAADELEAVKIMRKWHAERASAVVARQRLLFDMDM